MEYKCFSLSDRALRKFLICHSFVSAINLSPERVLPGRGSPFLEKGRKSTRGSHPWTPTVFSARKDTIFLLSFPVVPAIELLNRHSLRRNYESALKPGFCGDMTCGNCNGPFLTDYVSRSGFYPLFRTTAAGGCLDITLEASWHCFSG